MNLKFFQNEFITILKSSNEYGLQNEFVKWIHQTWKLETIDGLDTTNQVTESLEAIAYDIRLALPQEAILPSENIHPPTVGPDSGCSPISTVHLDEFLYDDDAVDSLVDEGKFSRHYCVNCGSRAVKPLTILSHSMSIDRIHFVFDALLPPLSNCTILDVGSRLGCVLYGAYLKTTQTRVVGVEMNPDFCQLQNDIICKYNFEKDRILIICDNILNQSLTLQNVQVVILNNAFDFFNDTETCTKCWKFLAQNIQPGALLVTIPSLQVTFSYLQVGFSMDDWVEEFPIYNTEPESVKDFINHMENVKAYRVKQIIMNV